MFDLITDVISAIEKEIQEILNLIGIIWIIFTSAFFVYVIVTNPFWRSDSKNYIISDQAELSRLFHIVQEAGGFDNKHVRDIYDQYQQATVRYLAHLESLSFWQWRREAAVCDEYKLELDSKIDSLRSISNQKGRVFNIKY